MLRNGAKRGVLGAGILFAALAFSKPVRLNWEPIAGATRYELNVERDGKSAVKTFTAEPAWKGDLGFGAYAYQVRAVDPRGRAGEWSQQYPVVVMAPAPQLSGPPSSEAIKLYQGQSVSLSWQPIDGVTKYLVEISQNGKVVVADEVKGSDFRATNLPEGAYVWSVRGLLEIGEQYAALSGRQWKTAPSQTRRFTLSYRPYDRPVIVSPSGDEWPSSDGIMKFSWKAVPGAEAYEVRFQKKSQRGRDVIEPVARERVSFSNTNSISLPVGRVGSFTWSVKAVAAIDRSKDSRIAGGPEAQAEFRLLRDYLSENNSYLLDSSLVLGLVDYRFQNRERNLSGSVAAREAAAQIRFDNWFETNLAYGFGIEDVLFHVNGKLNQRFAVDAVFRHRRDLSTGFFLTFVGGLQFRQFPEPQLGSSGAETTFHEIGAMGALGGAELSKQISERWSFRLRGNYFYPLIARGVSLGRGGKSAQNLDLGVQTFYWVTKSMGIAAGAQYKRAGLSYEREDTHRMLNLHGRFFSGYYYGSLVLRFDKK